MSGLAQQQRAVLSLLKNRTCELPEDEWLSRISQSRELMMLREIARWWRQYQVGSQCRFMTRLLKRLGTFETSVNQYFETSETSPYMEEMARGFLAEAGSRGDDLVREVALTELGLLGVAGVVEWDRNPDLVFAALEGNTDLPGRDPEFEYQLTIGPTLQCVRQRRVTLDE